LCVSVYWLQVDGDVEKLEGASLNRGELGIEHESRVGLAGLAPVSWTGEVLGSGYLG
jgi:hypothetical protein